MKGKVKEWLKRYLPAEVAAIIGAIVISWIVFLLTGNRILAAYFGVIGDNLGYYALIFIREHFGDLKKSKIKNKKHGILGFSKTVRNLILEFGPSEILDSFIIRPFLMYSFPIIIGNFGLGVLVATMVANIIFYIPTILVYELRKKHLS